VKKVGDYDWRQLSIWDFSPRPCIEKFVKSSCGKHVFHYYLLRVVEITSPNSWRNEVVTSVEGVPEDILNWKCPEYRVKQ